VIVINVIKTRMSLNITDLKMDEAESQWISRLTCLDIITTLPQLHIITRDAHVEMTSPMSKLVAAGLLREADPNPGLLGFCLKLSTM